MGRLQKLRKLQASFNFLRTLPEGMRHMEALELFRGACNPELEDVPPHLGTLVDAFGRVCGWWWSLQWMDAACVCRPLSGELTTSRSPPSINSFTHPTVKQRKRPR